MSIAAAIATRIRTKQKELANLRRVDGGTGVCAFFIARDAGVLNTLEEQHGFAIAYEAKGNV